MPARRDTLTMTPRALALGVFVWALSVSAPACEAPQDRPSERVRVASVHDGDSLRLDDDRRVRLIGVNAPELARDGAPAEPLAEKAARFLRQAVAGEPVTLVYGTERKDHYGRTLAHVYDAEGRNLEAALLAKGLAFHIAVAPNTRLADCLAGIEARAREAELGVWGHPGWEPLPAQALGKKDAGYQRVTGRVTAVDRAGGAVWLELDGPVVIRVPEALWPELPAIEKGDRLTLSGWLVDRSGSRAERRGFKPLLISLQSRYALESVLE